MTALRLTVDQLTTLRGREVAKKAAAPTGFEGLRAKMRGHVDAQNKAAFEKPLSIFYPRHKYRAQRTEADGIKFASKAEAGYYAYLKAQQLAGKLAFFLMQTRIDIPGGHYRLDFLEFWANGDIRWVDVKGMRLPAFEIKRRAVEALYPFKITIARMTKNGPVFEAAK